MLKILRNFRRTIASIAVGALLLTGLTIFRPRAAAQETIAKTNPAAAKLPAQTAYFEENRGQFNEKVRYSARGTGGYSLFLTPTAAVYVLASRDAAPARRDPKNPTSDIRHPTSDIRHPTSAVAVYMTLAGANENAAVAGADERAHRTNYFRGAETDWRTNIPNYGAVRVSEVYAGVDLVWRGRERGGVEYDFAVKPSADPAQIAWEIAGADSAALDADGNLVIQTVYGAIRQNRPLSYQEADGVREEVASRFVVQNTAAGRLRVGFEVGDYDRTRTLTIDPSVNLSNLSFSTYLGGEDLDYGTGVAVDRAGSVYVSGDTYSTGFPVTPGTFDPSLYYWDTYVTKLNPAGTGLAYSTYLGGSNREQLGNIAVDATGSAYLTGQTDSSDFPTTPGAFDRTYRGGWDGFVVKLDPTGAALTYSTYLGGSAGSTLPKGIAVDAAGDAFVAGSTLASDYPTTTGVYDTSFNGGDDVFVAKLNATGTALLYSTFIGGDSSDQAYGIAVDSAGDAYVTGATASTGYPTTAGAYDTSYNGSGDVFATKLNPAGSALIFSTFIGTSDNERGLGIAINAAGNAYIAGNTNSSVYPTTTGAYDRTYNGGYSDVFVTKLDPTGTGLRYSTYIGGAADEYIGALAVDATGSAYVTGISYSSNYPTTAGAYDATYNGVEDGFVTKINPVGTAVSYSTFLGGTGSDSAVGIAVDAAGNAFVTGYTNSTDYPTTAGAFQPLPAGGGEAFVTMLGDYTISGRAVDTSGAPLANTAIAFSNDCDGFMLTDAQGYFGLADTLAGGTCLVSATNTLYNFNPANYELTINRSKRVNFVGRPTASGPTVAYADLGGDVTSTAGSVGLSNTTLTLLDSTGRVTTTTTDAAGNYRFANVRTGEFYLVFAQRDGYSFMPATAPLDFLQQKLDVDFAATPDSPRPVQDFDGDGKSDLAVFRPAEGNWYILESQNLAFRVVRFGLSGDIPLAADYDGDHRADLCVFRPSDGNWYRLDSSNGAFSAVHFGLAGDKPVPADYDGDGRADLAVFRPADGVWHRLLSRDGSYQAFRFGLGTDRPLAADFDSDGRADPTVYRDGTWYRLDSAGNQLSIYRFGIAEDEPTAADFDGDGRPDTAVFRPSTGTWYWLDNADGEFHAVRFGMSGDVPVAADYDGDGRVEQAVYRGGTWYELSANGRATAQSFGLPTDVPVKSIR